MNVNIFTQQLEVMYQRLDDLYRGATNSVQEPQINLLPVAFKELGIVSEELQVAVEELQQQNEELAAARTAVEVERQRYQELFEFAPDGYLVTDLNGTIQEANRAATRLLNVSQRFLIGKPLIIFIPEQARPTFHSQLAQLLQQVELQEWSISLCPRNGQPFDVAVTTASISNWEGKVVGLRLCIRYISNAGRDLRSSKQVEIELKRDDNGSSQERPKHIYLRGEIITLNPQTIWQVCQGIVKLSTINEKGEEVLVGLAVPTMLFGSDLTLLQTYQAIALSNVQLESFSVTDITSSVELSQAVLSQIKQRLQQTEALLAISGQRRVRDRFFQLLQLLKREIGQPMAQGTRLSVRFTHQDLADACSTTRVTITRLLGKLQEQGEIIMDSKSHIIVREQDS